MMMVWAPFHGGFHNVASEMGHRLLFVIVILLNV